MTKLLYIGASPRGDKSDSGILATHFLGMAMAAIPDLKIDHIDLWNTPLPRFDGDVLTAKYALLQGEAIGEKESQAWQEITNIIERFKRADLFVIATPMWNFGVPYVLKHYIDILAQPGYTVQPQAAPYSDWGLLQDKKAMIISTFGGIYSVDSAVEDWNYLSSYLDKVLNFMGVKDTKHVRLEGTGMDLENLEDRIKLAKETLREQVSQFCT